MTKQHQKRSGSLRDETCPTRLSMVFHRPGSSDLTVPENELTLREAIDSLEAGTCTSFAIFHPEGESFAESWLTVSGRQNRLTGVQQDSLLRPPVPWASDQVFQIETSWIDHGTSDTSGRTRTRCSPWNKSMISGLAKSMTDESRYDNKDTVVVVSMLRTEPRWTVAAVQTALSSRNLFEPTIFTYGTGPDRDVPKLVSFISNVIPTEDVTATSVQEALNDLISKLPSVQPDDRRSMTIVPHRLTSLHKQKVLRQLCFSNTVDRPYDEDESASRPWHVEQVIGFKLSPVWMSDKELTRALMNMSDFNSNSTDGRVAVRVSHLPLTPSHASRLQWLW